MQSLLSDKYYHIYNRGNNREDLFYEPDNYQYFLRLYDKYISPVADTFAWVLMKNHFHWLVRIKEEKEIELEDLPNPVRSRRDIKALFSRNKTPLLIGLEWN